MTIDTGMETKAATCIIPEVHMSHSLNSLMGVM